jgi:predicted permease
MLGNLISILVFTWVTYAVIGFLAGLFQWVVLRREVQRSAVWLLAAALGNAAYAMSIYALLGFPGRSLHDYPAIALSSAVTGLFLILLLRRPLTEAKPPVAQAAA